MGTLAELNVLIGARVTKLDKGLADAERSIKRAGKTFRRVGKDLTFNVTAPLVALGTIAVASFGKYEKLTRAMESQMGNAKAAAEEIKKLEEVAKAPGLGFEQAIRGSVRLQAVELNADLARNALSAFGNAIALAGGEASGLDGVTLALTQIAAKGKISAEEINQLAERVPQIRAAMKGAFGTADTTALQKANIDATKFIEGIVAELAKLPQATGGINNSFENLRNSVGKALAALGEDINETFNLKEVFDKIGNAINAAVTKFKALDKSTKKTILTIVGIAAAIGPAIFAIGSIIKVVAILKVAFVALRVVLIAFTGPVGLIVAAVVHLVIGLRMAWKNSEKFRGVIKGLARTMSEVFKIFKESLAAFRDGFNALKQGNFSDAAESFKKSLPILNIKEIGERVGNAYSDGFAEGIKPIEDTAKKSALAVQNAFTGNSTFGTGSIDLPSTGGGNNKEEAPFNPEMFTEQINLTFNPFERINELTASVGDGFLDIGDKVKKMSQDIKDSVPEAEEVVMTFGEMVGRIAEGGGAMGEAVAAAIESMKASADSGVSSLAKFASAAMSAGRKVIGTLIREGVAGAISKALVSAPGPFGLALAAAGGIAAQGLFNKLLSAIKIPAFAEGGFVSSPTLAMVGEKPGSRGEFIVPFEKMESFINQAGGGGMGQNLRLNLTGEMVLKGDDFVHGFERHQIRLNRSRGG